MSVDNLVELLLHQAEARPHATAVASRHGVLTFEELERQSAAVRTGLVRGGLRQGDRVCLLVPKSPTAIVSILGVLRAGGVYVPIDPDGPPARSARVVQRSETPWILAYQTGANLAQLAEVVDGPLRVGWLGQDDAPELPTGTVLDREDVLGDIAGDDRLVDAAGPAYMMFTSGSTGLPKGVVVTHANVLAFLHWAIPYFGMGPDDRIPAHPQLHFDLSVFDLFGALMAGAELHLVPAEFNVFPTRIVDVIEEARLTQWFSVPGVMTLLSRFDLLDPERLASLRRVLWCGEVLPTPVLIDWMETLPDVEFTNLYGPTEATIASSYYRVPEPPSDPADPLPIGFACDGEELLVLDNNMDPVEDGEIGDLWIAGAGVSPGYWRDPEKTAAAFVEDPRPGRTGTIYRTGDLASRRADGALMFHGRQDRQIKSRGYRIELDEIEMAVNALPEIRQGAVVAVRSGDLDTLEICCAYVPESADATEPVGLKSALRDALPIYMIPRSWRRMDRLPENVNGKVDRPALKALFADELAGGEGE